MTRGLPTTVRSSIRWPLRHGVFLRLALLGVLSFQVQGHYIVRSVVAATLITLGLPVSMRCNLLSVRNRKY